MSQVRQPGLEVRANGIVLDGALEARVISNDHFSSDRFTIRLAEGADSSGLGSYFALPDSTVFTIAMRQDADAPFLPLITGQGDTSIRDQITRVVSIEGRDLTALLQDVPVTGDFPNLTSSEIVTEIALRHGLIPVALPTSMLAGRYFQGETRQLAINSYGRFATEWDLVVHIAQCEGYDVFAVGNALFFQPALPPVAITKVLDVADLIELRLMRRLRLSGPIAVTVRSWNAKEARLVSATALSHRIAYPSAIGPIGTSSPAQFTTVRPNLTSEDAGRIAMSQAATLGRHEQCVEFSMPGEGLLTPRAGFLLKGTGTDFDQIYQIDTIERVFGPEIGFVQYVTAHAVSNRIITLTTDA
ncbi:MAG: hypothetical protein J0H57_00340 [Rhodospirillales bacterium]|nr:hypothetical protein [Rhodospirillales bacterium]